MKILFLFITFFSSILFSQTWVGTYTGTADVYFYSNGSNNTNRNATLYVNRNSDQSIRMTLKANVPNYPFGSTDYFVYTDGSFPNGSNYSGQKRDGAKKYYINCTLNGNQMTGAGDRYTVATNGTETPDYTITFNVENPAVGVSDLFNNPLSYSLSQNFPNPFNPATKINFSIPWRSFITLKIYNFQGEEISTLINEEKEIGNYEVGFDGSNLSSGVYFYKIQAGNYTDTKKLILIK
jgi:hypothetical protein